MNRNRSQHGVGFRRRHGRRIWRTWAGIAQVVWKEIRARPNRARLYETHHQVAQFGRPDRQDPRHPSLIAYGLHDDRPVRIVRDAGMVFSEVWDPEKGWWVPSARTSWRTVLEEASYISPELLQEQPQAGQNRTPGEPVPEVGVGGGETHFLHLPHQNLALEELGDVRDKTPGIDGGAERCRLWSLTSQRSHHLTRHLL